MDDKADAKKTLGVSFSLLREVSRETYGKEKDDFLVISR